MPVAYPRSRVSCYGTGTGSSGFPETIDEQFCGAGSRGLIERADQQHAWVLAGDNRGIYGDYSPAARQTTEGKLLGCANWQSDRP